jgi:hemolysin activation/secretion protein
MSLPAGQTLRVDRITLEGADGLSTAEAHALLAPYQGRSLTMTEIEQAAEGITRALRQRGFMVARAYVPRQDASKGILLIRVLIGRYGQVRINNQSKVSDGWMARTFSSWEASHVPIQRADVERRMLLVSDMPGAGLPQLTISPGSDNGTSDVSVLVPAGPRPVGWVMLDNEGARYTGEQRLSGGWTMQSPLGWADRLGFSGMGTVGGRLLNGRASYEFPLTTQGLRGELAYAKTTYALGDAFKSLEATGNAYTTEASLRYPLWRTRERNVYVNLGLARRRLHDEVGSVDTDTSRGTTEGKLGLQFESWGHWLERASYTRANLSITKGHLSFGTVADKISNQAGANTAGDYNFLGADLSTQWQWAPPWSVSLGGSFQRALDRNLDSSAQFNIAGASGVRAYRESATGNNGWLVSHSVRHALPSMASWRQSVAVFSDAGRAWLQHGEYSSIKSENLSDLGLSYDVSVGKGFGQLALVKGLSGAARGDRRDEGDVRVLVRVGVSF